jgi:hypothetical protein
MTTDKNKIVSSLKKITAPYLRKIGFKGLFPNFYRDDSGFISLINFQFYSSGGSFCVNVSYADPERTNIYIDRDLPSKKLRVSQTTNHMRLKGHPDEDWEKRRALRLRRRCLRSIQISYISSH